MGWEGREGRKGGEGEADAYLFCSPDIRAGGGDRCYATGLPWSGLKAFFHSIKRHTEQQQSLRSLIHLLHPSSISQHQVATYNTSPSKEVNPQPSRFIQNGITYSF